MSDTNNIADARTEDGIAIGYEVLSIAANIAINATHELKEYQAYKVLVNTIDSHLVDFYFYKFFYDKIFQTAIKIAEIKWCVDNNHSLKKEFLEISNFPWIDLLEKVWPNSIIKFKKRSFLQDLPLNWRNFIRGFLKKYIIELDSLFYRLFIKLQLSSDEYLSENSNYKSCKIAVNYMEGIDFGKRTDIFWFPNSGIDPTNVLIYFENDHFLNRYDKSENVIKDIEKLGFKWATLFRRYIGSINNLWIPTNASKNSQLEDIKSNIKECIVVDKTERWLNKEILRMVDKIDYWYAFFSENNIKIHHDMNESGLENIIKNMALKLVGGCSFGKERGFMVNGNGFFGCYPNDIFFLWGKGSAKRFINSTNIKKNVLISGEPYARTATQKKNEISSLKKKLNINGARFIVLLLDNMHSMQGSPSISVSTPTMQMFYEYFLKWALKDNEIGLIIKSKKPVIQETLPGILDLIKKAEKTGRCFNVPDPFRTEPADFAEAVDFVVSISFHLPGALIKTIFNGTRGIIYDYSNWRSIEKELYDWGNEKVIFDDFEKMTNTLIDFKANPESNMGLGDWSANLDHLDPFRDKKGGERIGIYLRWLQEGFVQQLGRYEAVNRANALYAKEWGDDKIAYNEKATF
ncbi:MAG: hypothetical protein GY705_17025 [Bacteroidetes bacterium]|nr:hypothetical protein [Bacteroidota bacterium]